VLTLQAKALGVLSATPQTADQIAIGAGVPDAAETIFLLLEHLAANGRTRMNESDVAGRATFRITVASKQIS